MKFKGEKRKKVKKYPPGIEPQAFGLKKSQALYQLSYQALFVTYGLSKIFNNVLKNERGSGQSRRIFLTFSVTVSKRADGTLKSLRPIVPHVLIKQRTKRF